ncbi:MAG: glutathione peroxidase [Bacteroidales bacterium]|nr:glutathione peroxidase [Bacteroidales bacterium]
MKHIRFLSLGLAVLLTLALGACQQKTAEATDATPADNVYQFCFVNGAGDTVIMNDYQGKVLLIVNTATQCGFTPQYAELQALYATYHDRGLEILDFPCNQFGEQAPGSIEEIHAFCTGTYGTTFPQMAKIDVNGEQAIPLYTWLKSKAPFGGFDTTDPRGAYLHAAFKAQDSLYAENPDIKWNFTKFLIDREGNVVCRFEPTAPTTAIVEALEPLL